jgi:biotin operon repressor
MPVPLVYIDGICRRTLIAEYIRDARNRGDWPSQRQIAEALGVSQHTVSYHMAKIREESRK